MEIPFSLATLQFYQDVSLDENRTLVPRYVRALLEELGKNQRVEHWFLEPDTLSSSLVVHERSEASTSLHIPERDEAPYWLLFPSSPVWMEIDREEIRLYKVHEWPDPAWQRDGQEMWSIDFIEVSQEAAAVLHGSAIFFVRRYPLLAGTL